jgi:hypothetical protein
LTKRIFGQALDGLADDGGLWNGRAFADWVSQLTGKPIHRQRGWEYLRQMNFRQKVPRPVHDEADIEQQLEWKKNSM